MIRKDNITITLYEHWMHHQVVRMICRQYERTENNQDELMQNFYEHPYQRERSIRIVALDGKKVVGFQSFFYWPYLLDGRLKNGYQSGNSIIGPEYRGMGIFQRLLNYLDTIRKYKQIDFLTGFPVKSSYGSFIRNKWTNILNLSWYIKASSPFSLFRRYDPVKLSLDKSPKLVIEIPASKGFVLNRNHDFEAWRENYSRHIHYFYFHFADGVNCVRFNMKVNLRLRGILKELIIGRVQTNCESLDFLEVAVKALVRKIYKEHMFAFISVALNAQYFKGKILQAFMKAGFKIINKQIYFCVKDFTIKKKLFQPDLWELYRSAIDTW